MSVSPQAMAAALRKQLPTQPDELGVTPEAMAAALQKQLPTQPDQLDLAEPSIGGVQQGNFLGWGLGDWANAAQNPKDTYKALIAAMRSRARTYSADDPQLTQDGIGTFIGEAPSVLDNPAMNWAPGPIGAAHGLGGIFGTLANKTSKTANLPALEAAKQMIAQGADPEAVTRATGWFKVHGNWVYEISNHEDMITPHGLHEDALAGFNAMPDDMLNVNQVGRPSDLVHMPGVMAAYPELNQLQAQLQIQPGVASGGVFNPAAMEMSAIGRSPQEALEAWGHETSHGVAKVAGLHPGGNPDTLAQLAHSGAHPEIERVKELITNKMDAARDAGNLDEFNRLWEAHGRMYDPTGKGLYYHLAGEAAARNDARRMAMTPQERIDKPWHSTLDVPEDEQLRMDSVGRQLNQAKTDTRLPASDGDVHIAPQPRSRIALNNDLKPEPGQ